MRMSTKGRFALNALIDLALRENAGPVALATIAARQQVSLSYLEQMFSRLRQAGIVESTRGPGGGYRLGRDAAQVTVAEVVLAVDDEIDAAGDGLSQALWKRLNEALLAQMSTITLQSLVDEQAAAGGLPEPQAAPRRAFVPRPAVRPARTLAPNSVFAFARAMAR